MSVRIPCGTCTALLGPNGSGKSTLLKAVAGLLSVASGVVPSLARPGGNVTGLASLSGALGGKRLELLRDTVPGLARVALLWNPEIEERAHELEEMIAAAQSLHVLLIQLWRAVQVGFVHGVILARLGNFHVGIGQHIGSNGRIEREPVHAVAGAVDEHGRRPVDDIACGHDLSARLQNFVG